MGSKLIAAIALSACAALFATGIAGAGGAAETKVTIQVEGRDFSGYVKSEKPRRCADGRKVWLWKQKGAEQNRREDQKIASDFADKVGNRYFWSTGNTGLRGKFYAKVNRTDGCKGDTSRTLRTEN